MVELKGKTIGLIKSLNTIKNDWWRIQQQQGIELMLRLNGMTVDDVEIVEFPYADDWYDDPAMLAPMENPSELWLKRDHKHDLAFRPLETALENGLVDAISTQSKPFQHPELVVTFMKGMIGKDFMLSHGHIQKDFDVHEWAQPKFLEQAATALLQEVWSSEPATSSASTTPVSVDEVGPVHLIRMIPRVAVAPMIDSRTRLRRRVHPMSGGRK